MRQAPPKLTELPPDGLLKLPHQPGEGHRDRLADCPYLNDVEPTFTALHLADDRLCRFQGLGQRSLCYAAPLACPNEELQEDLVLPRVDRLPHLRDREVSIRIVKKETISGRGADAEQALSKTGCVGVGLLALVLLAIVGSLLPERSEVAPEHPQDGAPGGQRGNRKPMLLRSRYAFPTVEAAASFSDGVDAIIRSLAGNQTVVREPHRFEPVSRMMREHEAVHRSNGLLIPVLPPLRVSSVLEKSGEWVRARVLSDSGPLDVWARGAWIDGWSDPGAVYLAGRLVFTTLEAARLFRQRSENLYSNIRELDDDERESRSRELSALTAKLTSRGQMFDLDEARHLVEVQSEAEGYSRVTLLEGRYRGRTLWVRSGRIQREGR